MRIAFLLCALPLFAQDALRPRDTPAELVAFIDAEFATQWRGLLSRTLLVWMGEFGRTPKVNVLGGRDHFTRAWSAALAGAGIRGRTVVGQTREDGMEVVDRPVSVPDLFATFCKALALDPDKSRKTAAGRPIPIVTDGAAIRELFA